MRGTLSLILAVVFAAAMLIVGTGVARASTASDEINPVQMDVTTAIAIACDASVTMNSITTGQQSTLDAFNNALCTVITNNAAGYSLAWNTANENMVSGTDSILPEGSTSTPPHTWTVAAGESGWSAKMGDGTTVYTARDDGFEWGGGVDIKTIVGDAYSGAGGAGNAWVSVSGASTYTNVLSTTTETSDSGDTVYVMFGAEIGASKSQPTGTYQTNVWMRATTD